MIPKIHSFLQAAQSNDGIGYVKLKTKGDSSEAVQYGSGFCARKFGWYSRPSAEQNRDVRSSFLMALADSPDNFCEEAINNAAVALGLKDVLLTAGDQPLSKREILKVFDMTRAFDRNRRLGLYQVSEGQISNDFREQFRRVRAGSTEEDAMELVRNLNRASYSYEDIHRKVVSGLKISSDHPLAGQLEILTSQINRNVEKILTGLDHLASLAEKNGIIDREVNRLVAGKLQAYQLLQDLCDPGKTEEPFSPRMAALLMKRCTAGREIAAPEYVRALYENRAAALPLLRDMSAERPSKKTVADSFGNFALLMQRLEAESGLSSEAMLDLSHDLLLLAADRLDMNFNEKFIHTSAAGQKFWDELWQELDFLNRRGRDCPEVRQLSGKDCLREFPLLNHMTGLLCREVNSELKEMDFAHVSSEARDLAKKLGTDIKDLDPFGKGPVTGEYGRGMREFILENLRQDAVEALKHDSPNQPLEALVEQMLKDVNRGYGLMLDDRIVNGAGECNRLTSAALVDAMQTFFTENGVLDRKAMVAASSFAHQGMTLLMLMNGAQAGLGPFTGVTSVDHPRSRFQIFRNDDQSYSIHFRSEVAGIRHFGIFGTPEHVLMDGDGRNSFNCDLTFRMSFDQDKPVFSFQGDPFYEYDFEPRLSEADKERLNQERIDAYGTEENIDRVYAAWMADRHLEELPPLTAEEKKAVCGRSITVMRQLAEDQGLLNRDICTGAIRPALAPLVDARMLAANLQRLNQAEADGAIQAAVEEKFVSHPEFSALKNAFLEDLKDFLKLRVSSNKERLWSQEEICRMAGEKCQEFLLKKGDCLTRLGVLATTADSGHPKVFPAMRFWLENQIKTGLGIRNPEYLDLLVDNQHAYLPFLEAAADEGESPRLLLNASLDCQAAAEHVREQYAEREDVGGGELQHLDEQLRELARLVFENTSGEKPSVSSERLQEIRGAAADLQYVVFNLGMKNAEVRQTGPVHGPAEIFEDLQQKFIWFQQHCADMLPEALGKIEDTADFSQVSPEVRMFLVDQGLILDDYRGTEHAIEEKLSAPFVSAMEKKISDYNREFQAKMQNTEDALRDCLADFIRCGQGLTLNGRRITGVDDGGDEEEIKRELVNLCTPRGKDQPDGMLIRAFGSLLHQGLAASFVELGLHSTYSPFRNSILGEQNTEFSITGNVEEGFAISYQTGIEGEMMMKLSDHGTAATPLSLEKGSGWNMSCMIELRRNDDGEVLLSIPEGMNYRMRFIPSEEAEA